MPVCPSTSTTLTSYTYYYLQHLLPKGWREEEGFISLQAPHHNFPYSLTKNMTVWVWMNYKKKKKGRKEGRDFACGGREEAPCLPGCDGTCMAWHGFVDVFSPPPPPALLSTPPTTWEGLHVVEPHRAGMACCLSPCCHALLVWSHHCTPLLPLPFLSSYLTLNLPLPPPRKSCSTFLLQMLVAMPAASHTPTCLISLVTLDGWEWDS